MEAPGTAVHQIRGTPTEPPPTQALVLHHEHASGDRNDAMADPFEATAGQSARKRMMTEGDPRPGTVEAFVSMKESIVERAAEEMKEFAQRMALHGKQLVDDWMARRQIEDEQRRAEEARRDSERKQAEEVLKAKITTCSK
jgi:hypothetical protein